MERPFTIQNPPIISQEVVSKPGAVIKVVKLTMSPRLKAAMSRPAPKPKPAK